MARITWQNVEAPRMSLYDYSQMNQTLNSAFRNLGDSITGIQEGHRDRVIDRNVGNLMRINDLDQLRSASGNYSGPYARQVLEAAQAREKFLREGRQADLTYDTGVENLAQTRAVNQSGELIARSQLAGYGGQELDPILASADPELRRRVGSLMSDAWTGAAENTRTHNQTALRDDRTHNRGMAQIGLQQRGLALREQEHQARMGDRALQQRAYESPLRAVRNLDPALSADEAFAQYVRSDDYQELARNGLGQAAEENFRHQWENLYNYQTAYANDGPLGPLRGQLEADVQQIAANRDVAQQNFYRDHPYMETYAAAQRLSGEGAEPVQFQPLAEQLAKTGVVNSSKVIETIQDRFGLTLPEIAALAATRNINHSFFSPSASKLLDYAEEYAKNKPNIPQAEADWRVIERDFTQAAQRAQSMSERLGRVANRNHGGLGDHEQEALRLREQLAVMTDPRSPAQLEAQLAEQQEQERERLARENALAEEQARQVNLSNLTPQEIRAFNEMVLQRGSQTPAGVPNQRRAEPQNPRDQLEAEQQAAIRARIQKEEEERQQALRRIQQNSRSPLIRN